MGLGHRRALTGRSSLGQNQRNRSSNKNKSKNDSNDSNRYSRNGDNRFGSKVPFRGEGNGRRSLAMPLLAAAIFLSMVGNQVVLQPRPPDDYAYEYEHSYEQKQKQKQKQNHDDSDSSQTSEASHNTNANTKANTYKSERALEHNHDHDRNHECTIPRFHIDDDKAWGQLGSTTGPVLLEGWKGFQPNDWTQSELMDHGRAGEFPQYLKDLTVQPLRKTSKPTQTQKRTQHDSAAATATRPLRNSNANENDDDLCVLKGKDVADLLGTGDHEPLLFFTNDQENKAFLDQVKLQTSYEVPSMVQHIDGFRVFSAMHRGKYHSMHSHGESWLGQVSGRRMWWFLPPTKTNKPPRVDACGYLTGAQPVPPGAEKWSCVQNPGEIIWFPKDWLHATCALDDWTVGIGAQKGGVAANRQNFPKLEPEAFAPAVAPGTINKDDGDDYRRRKQETLGACLGIGGDDGDGGGGGGGGVASSTETNNKTTEKDKTEKRNKNKKNEPTRKKEANNDKEWKWFDGDLNAYYNSLETQIHDRDPSKIASYAVHRWMGPKRSTEEHYELIDRAVAEHHTTTQSALSSSSSSSSKLKVFDAGCGLGSALMFFEKRHPDWDMTGHTISEEQHKFVETKLPKHNFRVNLRSYDEIDAVDGSNKKISYDVIYSIEALIHSPNVTHTMKEWVDHLEPGGIVVIIDDYVSDGVDKHQDDIQAFSKSWLANVLITPTEFEELAKDVFGLRMVENRDLLAEYEIVKHNYRNQKPVIKPVADRNHQGWMGSKWRQRLTVEGKLSYNMIVLKKDERDPPRRLTDDVTVDDETCASVPSIITSDEQQQQHAPFTEITPQLMSGRGAGGGEKMACISGWYCCNKGFEWYDHLDAHRTDNTAYLKLDRNLFGHYIEVFAKHLNDHYGTYPASTGGRGRFLDIGGTGSTASGMTKVTSKFQHFAGPLEYWKLDSDRAAKDLERTLFCDIDDCPAAESCGFDVTFSHTVLEHAKRPWKSFDTIARITKRGGLTMHLVPWSYQYHATPDDNYRFSHKALVTLLEDRGFDVLEVGYDICTKPDKMKNRVDEHYDVIWLTYVVGRKR